MKILLGCVLLLIGALFMPTSSQKHESIGESLNYWAGAVFIFPGLYLVARGMTRKD